MNLNKNGKMENKRETESKKTWMETEERKIKNKN